MQYNKCQNVCSPKRIPCLTQKNRENNKTASENQQEILQRLDLQMETEESFPPI